MSPGPVDSLRENEVLLGGISSRFEAMAAMGPLPAVAMRQAGLPP
jgi:hypothetical protein